jgi:glutathione S-transferase
MILIGQFDSPFVRRVGIALDLYGFAFTHRPWSTFGDAALIGPLNPLCRVPTLVLDEGEALADSHVILAYLDSLVGADRALMPRAEPARRAAFRMIGLATGAADAAVSLFYELRLHTETSETLVTRRRAQVMDTLAVLEQAVAGTDAFLFEGRIGHADIALAAMFRFVGEAHAGFGASSAFPAIAALAGRCEQLPSFARIAQRFIPPS